MAIVQTRRSLLVGIGASLFAAPAIVRAASLMPVRGPRLITFDEYIRRILRPAAERARMERQAFARTLIGAIKSGDAGAILSAGDAMSAEDPVGARLVMNGVLRSAVVGPSGYVEWRLPPQVLDQ